MRSLAPGALLVGLAVFVGCGSKQDFGLLALTLTADAQNPPAPAVTIDLVGSGSMRRSHAAAFPPAGGGSFLIEYPDLPAGEMTFTVQTLDGGHCVVGETPAPFPVTIKANAKNTAQVSIGRALAACGDGGVPSLGHDSAVAADAASALADVSAVTPDAVVDGVASNPTDVASAVIDAPVDVTVDAAASDAGKHGHSPAERKCSGRERALLLRLRSCTTRTRSSERMSTDVSLGQGPAYVGGSEFVGAAVEPSARDFWPWIAVYIVGGVKRGGWNESDARGTRGQVVGLGGVELRIGAIGDESHTTNA